MKVKNINGTSGHTCKCGSRIKHWEKYSGTTSSFCQAIGCYNTDVVGAHVQKGGNSTDQSWFIYPLCNSHNQHKGELEVSSAYALIPANVSETCGKGK